MKIRNGFVSNSSSSSFIITNPNNFEKAKELVNTCYCADYKVYKDVMYTTMISDQDDNYSDFRDISADRIDGNHSMPYNEDAYIMVYGEKGIEEVPIPIEGLTDEDMIDLGVAPYHISSIIYLRLKRFFEEEGNTEAYSGRVNELIEDLRELGGWYED